MWDGGSRGNCPARELIGDGGSPKGGLCDGLKLSVRQGVSEDGLHQ